MFPSMFRGPTTGRIRTSSQIVAGLIVGSLALVALTPISAQAFPPDVTPNPLNVAFNPQVSFSVGSHPYSVALADINGDGHPDIITTNSTGTVSAFFGDGNGYFTPTTLKRGLNEGSPTSVAVADVDGDGNPDIIAANYMESSVTVFYGDGKGNFTACNLDFPTGAYPFAMAVSDFDGDGVADVATANASGSVTVLYGGLREFFYSRNGFDFPAGSFASGIAVADVNGDDHPDVITANGRDNTVSVLKGTGEYPEFLPSPVSPAVGNGPYSVAAADVNGDGRPDIVTANYFDSTVSVILNAGLPPASLVTTASATSVAAGTTVTFTTTGADASGKTLGDQTAGTTFTSTDKAGNADLVTGSPARKSITFLTAGVHTITATENGITAPPITVTVTPGPLAFLITTGPTTAVATTTPITFTTAGTDAYANPLGDQTTGTTFTSKTKTGKADLVTTTPTGTTITFRTPGIHTITATKNGVTATPITITVMAKPARSPR